MGDEPTHHAVRAGEDCGPAGVVSPIQAAKSRPDLNVRGSGVFIIKSDAPTGPTPGISAMRR